MGERARGVLTQELEGHSSHLVQDSTQDLRWVLHRQRALNQSAPSVTEEMPPGQPMRFCDGSNFHNRMSEND